ncbi:MAG TPA: hypothetical protein ENG69_03425 [Candidatus Korarchaeota archaeon]|nr:hypothetical protein [Candidatus Korarchaeota archaeon]
MPASSGSITIAAEQAEEVVAGALARVGAFLIDLVILGFITGPLTLLALSGGFLRLWAVASLDFFVYTAYFSLLEGYKGVTIGKAILGLRVISDDFRPATYLQTLVRGLLRGADIALFGFVMLVRPDRRRIGDCVAGTLVVAEKKLALKIPKVGQYRALKELKTRDWERDRAIVDALLAEMKERADNLSEDIIDTLLNRIAASERKTRETVIKESLELLEVNEEDWKAAILTYALMKGVVTFKQETFLERAADVYERASQLAFRLEDRLAFDLKAKIAKCLSQVKKRAVRPDLRGGLAWVARQAPLEFRSSLAFFGASALLLLLGALLGFWLGSGFVGQLRELFGPPRALRGVPPEFLAVAIGLNNVRVDLSVLLGSGPALYPVIMMLITNGVIVGAFAARAFASGEGFMFLSLIAPHGIGELSLFLIASAGGMKLAWRLLAPKRGSRLESLKEARNAVALPLFSALLLPIFALVEAFLTPRLEGNVVTSVVVGISLVIPIFAWLGTAGKNDSEGGT